MNEAFKKNHKYWENLAKEQRKQQEEQRKQQEEQNKQQEQEQNKQQEEQRKQQRKQQERIKEEAEKPLPDEIIKFLNNPIDKKLYRKLQKEYHPDKQKYSKEICNRYTQAITSHKSLRHEWIPDNS